jgi:large subunit ribosomal protein L32
MPVPKRKRSRSRRDKRFANKALAVHTITACLQCKAPIRPHQACAACGYYKGAKVMQAKAERANKRSQDRAKRAPQPDRMHAAASSEE